MEISLNGIERFWLYSSAFNNGWWCYAPKYYKQLDAMYKQHCKKKNYNNKKVIKCVKILSSDKLKNDEKCVDLVDFSDTNEDDNDDNSDNEEQIINYTLVIDKVEFKIDMENMRQINMEDMTKRRHINYLDIPNNITDVHDIVKFLIDHKIKGIAGTNFTNITINSTNLI